MQPEISMPREKRHPRIMDNVALVGSNKIDLTTHTKTSENTRDRCRKRKTTFEPEGSPAKISRSVELKCRAERASRIVISRIKKKAVLILNKMSRQPLRIYDKKPSESKDNHSNTQGIKLIDLKNLDTEVEKANILTDGWF